METKINLCKNLMRVSLILSILFLIYVGVYGKNDFTLPFLGITAFFIFLSESYNVYLGIKYNTYIFYNWSLLSFFRGKWFVVFKNERAKKLAKIKLLRVLIILVMILVGILYAYTSIGSIIHPGIIFAPFLIVAFTLFKIEYAAFYNTKEEDIQKRNKDEFSE